MPPTLYLALGIAVVAFIGGWKVESWRWSASLLETERAVAAARLEKENELDQIAARYERTRETLARYQAGVRERVVALSAAPAYAAGACLDPDGVQLVNRVAAGATDPGKPPSPVPPAAAP